MSLYNKLLLKIRILPMFKKGTLINARHKRLMDRYSSGFPHRWEYAINIIGTHTMFFVLSVMPKSSKQLYLGKK